MKTFFLGAHMPHWAGEESPLWFGENPPLPGPVPLCISRVRLAGRATLPRAVCQVLLDSGGFSVLSREQQAGIFADWDITPREFIRQVRRICEEMGNVVAIAPMDWMCGAPVIANTGLTVTEHRRRTVGSLLELRWLANDLGIFPVLQGDATLSADDHLRCADMYEAAGIDLTAEPLVGVGSIVHLQPHAQINLLAALHRRYRGTVRFHGFGAKARVLGPCGPAVHTADSITWAMRGMNAGPCRHGLGHRSEANCPHFAAEWRETVLTAAVGTTPAAWEKTVKRYEQQGAQALLFAADRPAPNMPTFGEALERATRAFLPEGGLGKWRIGDEHGTGLATLLDTFRETLTAPSTDDSGNTCP